MRRAVIVLIALFVLLLLGGLLSVALVAPEEQPEVAKTVAGDDSGGNRRRVAAEERAERDRLDEAARNDPRPEREIISRPAVERGDGVLNGVMIDDLTREPVIGARVDVMYPTGRVVGNAATDRAGSYEIAGLPNDVPLVARVIADGFVAGLCCDIDIRRGGTEKKDVRLIRRPSVHVELQAKGRLDDEDLGGVNVVLLVDGDVVARAQADEHGKAELLAPGYGEFEVRAGGSRAAHTPAVPITTMPGTGDVELKLDVYAGGEVEVHVTDGTSEGVAGAEVTIAHPAFLTQVAVTDVAGIATIDRLSPDVVFDITARHNELSLTGHASIKVSDGRSEAVVVRLVDGGFARGVVRGGKDLIVSGATVTLRLPSGAIARTVQTAEDGSFVIARLGVARGELLIEADGYDSAVMPLDEDPAIELAPHLGAKQTARIHGSVRDDAGSPVKGATVEILPLERRVLTDAAGEYAVADVPAGAELRVRVRAEGMRPRRGQGSPAPRVVLRPRRSARIDIVMQKRSSSRGGDGADPGDAADETRQIKITGHVRERSGRAIHGAVVMVGLHRDRTDGEGAFALRSVTIPTDMDEPLPELFVTPPDGLLLGASVDLAPPGDGDTVDVGDVQVWKRPVALLRLGGAPIDGGATAFTLVTEIADHLLGKTTRGLQPQLCISYDGTWMHVPPAHSWQSEGSVRVWVAQSTNRGPRHAEAEWYVRPDEVAELQFDTSRHTTDVTLRVPKEFKRGTLTMRYVRSPLQVVGRTDPLARLVIGREFTLAEVTTRVKIDGLAWGRWKVTVTPPLGSGVQSLEQTLEVTRKSRNVTLRGR